MTNKIEITRELAELCAQCLTNSGYELQHSELRDLLAAPAVERQEPSEWRYRFTHRGELSKWFPVDSYMKLYVIANDPAYEIQPLYTSPPAPVALVLDENSEFKCAFPDADRRPDGSFIHAEDANKWSGWQARACLDKVKELNQ